MSNNDFNTYAVGDPPREADSTLLNRARAAKNGEKFGAYYDRGEFPRSALSRAEFGLCMTLISRIKGTVKYELCLHPTCP